MERWASNQHNYTKRVQDSTKMEREDIAQLISPIPSEVPTRSPVKATGYSVFVSEFNKNGQSDGNGDGQDEDSAVKEKIVTAANGKVHYDIGDWRRATKTKWDAMSEDERGKWEEKAREMNELRSVKAVPTKDVAAEDNLVVRQR